MDFHMVQFFFFASVQAFLLLGFCDLAQVFLVCICFLYYHFLDFHCCNIILLLVVMLVVLGCVHSMKRNVVVFFFYIKQNYHSCKQVAMTVPKE